MGGNGLLVSHGPMQIGIQRNVGDNEHHLSFRTSNASFHDSGGSTTRGYLIEHTSDPRPANHLDATLTITTDDLGNKVGLLSIPTHLQLRLLH